MQYVLSCDLCISNKSVFWSDLSELNSFPRFVKFLLLLSLIRSLWNFLEVCLDMVLNCVQSVKAPGDIVEVLDPAVS